MVMGSKTSFIIRLVAFYCLCSLQLIRSMDGYDHEELDDFIREYAQNSMSRRHNTGTLYNISLPSNFSDIEVSIVRLRSSSFWARGANYSYFDIPPRIMPTPYVTRLDIVYTNLRNWSSYYYDVENYTFVTPVLGLNAYDPRNTTGRIGNLTTPTKKLNLTLDGNPILVRFPNISLPQREKGKCVMFWRNGSFEMTNMTLHDACIVWEQGHFSVAVPTTPPPPPPPPTPTPAPAPQPPAPSPPRPLPEEPRERWKLWKSWVIGFGVGIFGLLLFGFAMFMVIRCVRMRTIKKMERQSERNEALDTRYVGHSRMPSASGVRTQPVLENDYFP